MGNVLIEYDVNRPLDALCPNEESKKIIRRELFESEDWLEGDRGNITDAEMLAAAEAVLKASGDVVRVPDENGIDLVGAIPGSGPAYVFRFMEALEAVRLAEEEFKKLISA